MVLKTEKHLIDLLKLKIQTLHFTLLYLIDFVLESSIFLHLYLFC